MQCTSFWIIIMWQRKGNKYIQFTTCINFVMCLTVMAWTKKHLQHTYNYRDTSLTWNRMQYLWSWNPGLIHHFNGAMPCLVGHPLSSASGECNGSWISVCLKVPFLLKPFSETNIYIYIYILYISIYKYLKQAARITTFTTLARHP